MKINRVSGPVNELDPEFMSVCINLNVFPYSVSASRQYMLGGNVGKSVRIKMPTARRITSGFETQYAKPTRKVVAPSNMTVERVFYKRNQQSNGKTADDWTEIYVVFFNEELQRYDLLVLPKYNTQNSYVAWEYVYDKDMLRRLSQENATFRKGEEFAKSPGIIDSGEWAFGREATVCGLTADYTEEDGIGIVDDFLEAMGTIFKHKRSFQYNETEYVMLNLYGTIDNPRGFPENGEGLRDDNIVMGFRRRDSTSALVSMTKRGLMIPDDTYDILFYAPANSVVVGIDVTTERYKNRSHNKSSEKPIHEHNRILDRYSEIHNRMANEVKEWTTKMEARYRESDLPFTKPLLTFCFKQLGEVIKDYSRNKYNLTKAAHRYKNRLDWNIEITLREEVSAQKRFKMTDTSGGKGVIVKVIPAASAPRYPNGRRADIIINNTPAFRRQIFTSLIEAYVNLVNMDIFDRIKVLVHKPKGYELAWDELFKFYMTFDPDFGELAEAAFPTEEERSDHVDYILREGMISVHAKSNMKVHGIELVRQLKNMYPDIRPQKAKYINDFGQEVETINPVVLSSMYFMMLNKFGTDISGISTPRRNLFGMPAKLSINDRYRNWHRDQAGRNIGEDESRNKKTQVGGEEAVRSLIAATSPDVALKMDQRIIRAEDPFKIKNLIRDSEMGNNRALHMAMNLINDAGYALREENDADLVEGNGQ